MSASDEVEEMSLQHFWPLAAAFAFAAMLHVAYEREVSWLYPQAHTLDPYLFLMFSLGIAYLSARVRARRGGDFAVGFILGAMFGVFGLLLALSVPPLIPRPGRGMKVCDRCYSSVRREALICARCRQVLEPWSFTHGRWGRGRWERVDAEGRRLVFDERQRGRIGADRNAIPPMPVTVVPDTEEALEETSQRRGA